MWGVTWFVLGVMVGFGLAWVIGWALVVVHRGQERYASRGDSRW